ncbi:MAG TPA: acetyl-CoA carboxylase biotin carboxylase subunit [Pyrinomonadaceae bacterium]|nr:acetyl-CoA carboxylase biotin carboxylase subunit [Chloracidobacterium sp.]MBP9934537.1 acetyl-CoA carboxylase biotin carboxylase subunit [Pyrinomonadaceae bacterium]MBK7802463.1 acetyl-CoA carboxylase biotin carboxylase subunit [Chloracidobacterium sp.]MBK9437331.1 acetyl-CoA carboxylase biotin carboxylase subunit [Chloracidobacterium sp.]MBL0240005.1 acetyl-CoA carboxylase biotin carboxylase subunit [Chloracidobacterium sp.]
MREIRKVLIANRGEIACRIIWTCKEMGIKTVAVHSEADREALHVRFADEAICIGPAASAESYLNIPAIISAAEITNVDSIHPGYGFLAESATFAKICEDCNIKFIGPPADVIAMMGDKVEARRTMAAAGVPILPGSPDPIESAEEALKIALEIGFPLIIKAAAGGGGRGMRIVREESELQGSLELAQTEALNAFKNGSVYIERYIERPRHIEIQVLADEHGNVIHLGERECTIQRRHQKLLEEAPSSAISQELRDKMGAVAVKACQEIGYTSAGTFEFLLDEDGSFYFMEMNTRIQVEHPVTEMVTLADIVRNQILIATGENIGYSQDEVQIVGHSIECRINAEDPVKFTPSPGKITAFNIPGGPGVRVDTAVYPGYVVPPYYDSMIAKLIVHARTRELAIARMRRALQMMVVEGIKTTIPLHLKIMDDENFQKGEFSTKFMEEFKYEI